MFFWTSVSPIEISEISRCLGDRWIGHNIVLITTTHHWEISIRLKAGGGVYIYDFFAPWNLPVNSFAGKSNICSHYIWNYETV